MHGFFTFSLPRRDEAQALSLPRRQFAARRPGRTGGFEGLVECGQVGLQERTQRSQGFAELSGGDVIVLAVRAVGAEVVVQ